MLNMWLQPKENKTEKLCFKLSFYSQEPLLLSLAGLYKSMAPTFKL